MSYFTPQSGFWDSFTSGLKTAGKTALDIQLEAARQQGASAAQLAQIQAGAGQQQGMPGWVLPVALGGGALVVVMLLMKKGQKRENPGRRRRRRR
jgi:hypothetical protein